MLRAFRLWRRKRILQRHALPEGAWHAAVAELPLLRGLSAEELARLRELAALFLHEKQVVAANGYALSEALRLKIAAQACLPILNLGLECYAGWVAVIVYPDEFVPEHEYIDDAGVVHLTRDPMIGESWQRGPVILSGADVEQSGERDGVNVVIHELAHKLDMLNGAPDGYPPLHAGMDRAAWTRDFTAAYEDFCARADSGVEMPIDPYAAESPAEFFAVMSEAFFEIPHILQREYPAIYHQLGAFYRQDTAARQVLFESWRELG
ncbi:MAG: zinc-dependent peptidase [Sulfuricella sp.]|nr:zinc-dependent peptidase [Sulfuricella sp.]